MVQRARQGGRSPKSRSGQSIGRKLGFCSYMNLRVLEDQSHTKARCTRGGGPRAQILSLIDLTSSTTLLSRLVHSLPSVLTVSLLSYLQIWSAGAASPPLSSAGGSRSPSSGKLARTMSRISRFEK